MAGTTTTSAFNQMMRGFLEELHATFPEEPKVGLVLEAFDDLCGINAKKPMELFVAALAPHQALVMAKDPALFQQRIELPGGLDMSALWAKPDVDQSTRDAVWQYLQMLFMLGTTVQSLPPQLLATIESVAQSCATQMPAAGAGGAGGLPDLGALSHMLVSGLSGLMGGSIGAAAQPRRTKPARRLR